MGKLLPFIYVIVILVGLLENVYAILTARTITDMDGNLIYYSPISAYIGSIIYIDWIDVFLLWKLAIALEYCKYNLRCVYFNTLNLPIRYVLEHVEMESELIIPIYILMSLYAIYCLYGCFLKIISK
jgi:hypothetical protein